MMKKIKLIFVLFMFIFISCSKQNFIYTINYSTTIEDYTSVTLESITLSQKDSLKAINKFKKSKNYKLYAPQSDSVWMDLWIPDKQ